MKKTYNNTGDKKGKKINPLLIFTGIALVVLIVLLFFVILVSNRTNKNEINEENGAEITDSSGDKKAKFTSYFAGCGLLNDKCLDTNCDQYFLCNGEGYSVCEVYDCGAEFGIGTMDESGKINIERKAKDNKEKIIKVKNKCGGALEIVESGYANERLEVKVKITTAGDCEISGFLAACKDVKIGEGGGFKPAKFSDLGDDFYLVNVNNCGEMAEIIAIGENGISIK